MSVITVQLGQCCRTEQPKQTQHTDVHFQEKFTKMRLKKERKRKKERKEVSLKQGSAKARREQAAWVLLKNTILKSQVKVLT